jgi:hypothetical protein
MDGKTAPSLYSFAHKITRNAMQTSYFHLDDYMKRYWVTSDPKANPDQKLAGRIHIIERPDYEDAMHDHPWENISVILHGGYIERVPVQQHQEIKLDSVEFCDIIRSTGDVIHRKATDRHKIVMVDPTVQTISMFITGPWEQDWGFYDAERGKVYWREYLNEWN